MPAKMARSAPRPPSGLPEVAVAVPNCAFALQGARKIENIQASSGVIWGIPAKREMSWNAVIF